MKYKQGPKILGGSTHSARLQLLVPLWHLLMLSLRNSIFRAIRKVLDVNLYSGNARSSMESRIGGGSSDDFLRLTECVHMA